MGSNGRQRRTSLRWRIQFWHALILLLVVIGFGAATYFQQRFTRLRTIDSELAAAVQVLTGTLRSTPPHVMRGLRDQEIAEVRSPELIRLMLDLRVPGTFASRRYESEDEAPYFVIWRPDGTQAFADGTAATGVPKPERFARRNTPEPTQFRDRDGYREAFGPGPPGIIILVGRDIRPDLASLDEFLVILILIGAGVIALGLAGGWLLSRRSVQPIEQISQVASAISEQDLSGRIDATEMDREFEQLSGTLNETFERLQQAFGRQVQFTADASHELRTPLSVIRMHQELALSKDRSPSEYREALETCQRATDRMSALVESLLTLSRMDASENQLATTEFDLQDVIRETVTNAGVLGDARDISVTTNTNSISVNADRTQIGQVLTNLLTNAIAYSPEGSHVTVTTDMNDDKVTVRVSDNGPGIPDQHIAHVFDRFYRVEEGRSREVGGSGLGLAICKSIIHAHGGSINVRSDNGAVFEFTVPRSNPNIDGNLMSSLSQEAAS